MISRYERQGLRRGAVVDGRMPAPRTSPLLQKKKNLFLFLKRQGLRGGVVVDERMPAPRPSPAPPTTNDFSSFFQKRVVANTVEE